MLRLVPLLGLLALTSACDDPDRNGGPPLMWTVQAGSAAPSHLLGTMHIGIDARQDLPQSVWDAFDSAGRLVEEADLRSVDPKEYVALASLPSGQLDQLLPQDVWIDLITLLSEVSLERLRELRPWAVGSLVFSALMPEGEGMDLTLLKAAADEGKQRAFLEPWQDQLNAMNQVPLQDDVDSLVELVRNRKTYAERLARLAELYLEGDADAVYAEAPAAGAIPEPTDAFFDTFIVQRNTRWLPALEQHLQGGGVFVAVGFGHVLGPKGLVQTLQDKGYTVTRAE